MPLLLHTICGMMKNEYITFHLIKSLNNNNNNNNAIHVSLFSLGILVACVVSEFAFVTPKVRSRRAKRDIFYRFT